MEDEEEERLIRRVQGAGEASFRAFGKKKKKKKKNGRARLGRDGNSPAILNVPSRLDIPVNSHEHGVRNPHFRAWFCVEPCDCRKDRSSLKEETGPVCGVQLWHSRVQVIPLSEEKLSLPNNLIILFLRCYCSCWKVNKFRPRQAPCHL